MINEKYKMTFHFDLIDLEFNMFCFIYQSCVNVSLLLENPKSRIACQTQDILSDYLLVLTIFLGGGGGKLGLIPT